MDNLLKIEGVIENIIYQNEENGYTVFSVITDEVNEDGEDEIVCTAFMGHVSQGENVSLTGKYVVHPSYGSQFRVEEFHKVIPTTADGIEKYLGSGVIKGIGKTIAKRIVKAFGDDTFKIIEDFPERLAEVKGISVRGAHEISEIFKSQEMQRRAILFLQDFDISPVYAVKIYNQYKDNTIFILKNNPYKLADDIYGIGFAKADAIAAKVGFDMTSPHRIKSCIKYVLNRAAVGGHVLLPENILVEKVQEYLEMPIENIEYIIIEMQMEKDIYIEQLPDGRKGIYLSLFYTAENFIARKLVELSQFYKSKSKQEIDFELLEKRIGVELHEKQKEAVAMVVNEGVLVITGGPGTGKTTAINAIIQLLGQDDLKIELAAPTGKAAKRMSLASGREAKTIHRLLKANYRDDIFNREFEKNEEDPIDADLIIIDEASMSDTLITYNLLKAIPQGARLVMVGDADQLPSVGAGNVLKDIISSEVISVVKLTEIFRQSGESSIVLNAHKINNGEYPDLNENGKDFFFMPRKSIDDVVGTIVELAIKRLPRYLKTNNLKDIQVLSPMRKSPLGVGNLNVVLQNILNPRSKSKTEIKFRNTVFREGDKVMQIKNNYDISWRLFNKMGTQIEEGEGVFNGDEGIIQRINKEKQTLRVLFDDEKVVQYEFSQLEELDLSYAVTIHKSQGSEYRCVIMPIHNGPPLLLSRNLLYTGITRAKELVVLVGIPEVLYGMVDNDREVNRYTNLKPKLVKAHDFYRALSEE